MAYRIYRPIYSMNILGQFLVTIPKYLHILFEHSAIALKIVFLNQILYRHKCLLQVIEQLPKVMNNTWILFYGVEAIDLYIYIYNIMFVKT